MENPLRIGVIGLGRRWRRRYKPALRELPECFQVRAVYDQVHERAEREARSLRCDALAGVTPLLARDDIDALLLADPQWFGDWSITAAGRVAKPVYCGFLALESAATAPESARDGRPPVMVEMLPHLAPVGARLHEILRDQLGPARLVECERVGSAKGLGSRAKPLPGAAWVSLLDWCRGFMAGEPVSVQASGLEDGSFESILLEFPGARAVHIVQRRERHGAARLRLHVVAEQGSATLALPRRVSWKGPDGRHVHTFPRDRPLSRIALQRFYQAIRAGQPLEPGWEEVGRVLAWLEAARQSRTEGRRVAWKSE